MAQFQRFLSDGVDLQGGDWSKGVIQLSKEEAALAIRRWVHTERVMHITSGGMGYIQILPDEDPQELLDSLEKLKSAARNA